MSGDMITTAIVSLIGTFISGSGLGVWLGHKRKQKLESDQVALTIYTKVADEQDRWRRHLQEQISKLQEKLGSLQAENNRLHHDISKLQAHNEDLKSDNARLEQRVQELERELKQYREKHSE